MIYAIGTRLKYERAFAAGPVAKGGRNVGRDGRTYPGGFVFRTAEEARHFLESKGLAGTHMVMGVLADWDADTEEEAGTPYRRLVRDADAVKLDD